MPRNKLERLARVCLVGVACSACGSGDFGDAPGASGGQLTWSFGIRAPATQTLLAVVDDTAAGAALRTAVVSAFEHLDDDARADTSCGGVFDPAAFHPFDRSLVVVHPSTPGAANYSSPAGDPALRWQDTQYSDAGHSAWMAAVDSALAAPPAADGAPFAALLATRDSVALLQGAAAPSNAAEQAVLAALPPLADHRVLIALATEDQSPGEASDYGSLSGLDVQGVVPGAVPDPNAQCRPLATASATTPRYASWAAWAQRWPCQDPHFLDTPTEDCETQCLAHPIAIDSDGTAECRAMVSFAGDDPCPADLGWLDPLASDGSRAPRVDHDAAGDTRVCEIKQLAGAALDSCRNTLDCTDCEPGWCATLVPAFDHGQCSAGRYLPPFRLVHGADHARPAQVDIVCQEASAP